MHVSTKNIDHISYVFAAQFALFIYLKYDNKLNRKCREVHLRSGVEHGADEGGNGNKLALRTVLTRHDYTGKGVVDVVVVVVRGLLVVVSAAALLPATDSSAGASAWTLTSSSVFAGPSELLSASWSFWSRSIGSMGVC